MAAAGEMKIAYLMFPLHPACVYVSLSRFPCQFFATVNFFCVGCVYINSINMVSSSNVEGSVHDHDHLDVQPVPLRGVPSWLVAHKHRILFCIVAMRNTDWLGIFWETSPSAV